MLRDLARDAVTARQVGDTQRWERTVTALRDHTLTTAVPSLDLDRLAGELEHDVHGS